MTAEAVAACEGATAAGATDILIKDSHSSGRNLILADLPENVRIARSWSGHPFAMLQELDDSFDAVVLTGYHAKGGVDGNPLGHTMSSRAIHRVSINGAVASEFTFAAIIAATQKVPICFVSGDAGICADVHEANGNIVTVTTSEGRGASTISIAPARSVRLIREGVEAALRADHARCMIPLPPHFDMEIVCARPEGAYHGSWYPGMRHAGPRTLTYSTDDAFEMLRAFEYFMRG